VLSCLQVRDRLLGFGEFLAKRLFLECLELLLGIRDGYEERLFSFVGLLLCCKALGLSLGRCLGFSLGRCLGLSLGRCLGLCHLKGFEALDFSLGLCLEVCLVQCCLCLEVCLVQSLCLQVCLMLSLVVSLLGGCRSESVEALSLLALFLLRGDLALSLLEGCLSEGFFLGLLEGFVVSFLCYTEVAPCESISFILVL
jgi:hypothetical protein